MGNVEVNNYENVTQNVSARLHIQFVNVYCIVCVTLHTHA